MNLCSHAKTVIRMIFQWKQVTARIDINTPHTIYTHTLYMHVVHYTYRYTYFGFHYDRRNGCYLSNCTQLIYRTLSRVWQTHWTSEPYSVRFVNVHSHTYVYTYVNSTQAQAMLLTGLGKTAIHAIYCYCTKLIT